LIRAAARHGGREQLTGDEGANMSAGAQRGRPAPRFYTISEIAKWLDVSTRTVRRWIKSGELTAHRFGGLVRVSEADFEAFLALRRDA
jgi:excisionase family DNA binding protein